jgi:hypothetical protein
MPVYDGGIEPRKEDEREQESWADPPDSLADEWRGGEPPNQGDEWKRPDYSGGPEEAMWRDLLDEDGEA